MLSVCWLSSFFPCKEQACGGIVHTSVPKAQCFKEGGEGRQGEVYVEVENGPRRLPQHLSSSLQHHCLGRVEPCSLRHQWDHLGEVVQRGHQERQGLDADAGFATTSAPASSPRRPTTGERAPITSSSSTSDTTHVRGSRGHKWPSHDQKVILPSSSWFWII